MIAHHNHWIKTRPVGPDHRLVAPSRRDILRRMIGYGIIAPAMVAPLIAGLSALSGSPYQKRTANATNQTVRNDVLSQTPDTYPLPFGYHDQENGQPPAGFFKLDYLNVIEQALPQSAQLRGGNLARQAQNIHHWLNHAPYRPEPVKRTLSQPRQSPRWFLEHGGDSEDHAFMRYLAFLHLGFHPERLRILTLALPSSRRPTPDRHLHAVLCVYGQGDILVFDPLYPDPYSHQNAFGYRPLSMFNHRCQWLCQPQAV